MSPRQTFLRSEQGSATVEFVVIFMAFIAIVFFVVEVTLYMFFMASLEKAAQAGVRAAVVSSPVAPGVPLTIGRGATGIYGHKCSFSSTTCASIPTISCTGATCDATGFTRILNHMQGFNGRIAANNVTITYADPGSGIGFAGGPSAPMVTVTVSGVPFQTGILGLLLGDASGLATLPARSASMTGEDLAP
ncbi:MAG TPA: TadE/TadG family type IV pilus assembly protein [Hyphomonadaceae bacterium]|nr:TadE/TadG family type IV pilus assembly protein [Hyphomonadaceae bacterium]